MRSAIRLIVFFRILPPAHPMPRIGLAIFGVAGPVVLMLGLTPAAILVPLLLLQTLAASSGFVGPARRGHYDLLLTLGHPRIEIGVAHWLMSIGRGIVVWCVLALVEQFAPGVEPVMLAGGTTGLMVVASTAPWALTTGLPRLSGGLALIVCTSFAAAVLPGSARPLVMELLLEGTMAGTVLLVAIAAGSVATALRAIAAMNVPLEAVQ